MPPAQPVSWDFPPLDERLGLRRGSSLTPGLVDSIVRLGARLPFGQVPALLAHFTGVTVSAETVRRLTEEAGRVVVELATQEVRDLEQSLPTPPRGPSVQQVSVDGAMVPLVGGVWAEVKPLAVGTVSTTEDTVQTRDLSYFSRLTDAATFGRLATTETHRRGTSTAGTVVAITDGALWCQGFVDLHRPDAVRILDFPHALEHLAAAAQAAFGAGTAATSAWLGEQAHRLRHGEEDAALAAVAALRETPGLRAEAETLIRETQTYLATRQDHIRYATFVAAGYPIGSGCVESANKLVVEARLKGAGMHWARDNVDSLLALRCLLANGRWDQEWPALWRELRATRHPRPPGPAPELPAPPLPPPPPLPAPDLAAPRPKLVINGKPTADHPWKRGLAAHAKS